MTENNERKCHECGELALPDITTETVIRHKFTCETKTRSIQTYRWAGWEDAAIAKFLNLVRSE